MGFDTSRFSFDPRNDYFGVVMEQGRVQLDSDWNEWLAELLRRSQAGTLDIMGRAAYPATTPYAFQITASTVQGTNKISIGAGRMYVDGLLAENHGDSAKWDPALAEMSGSPQPPPSSDSDTIDFTQQPYLPNAQITGNAPYLVYLDVWTRPITYLENPNLVDAAIGIDTTGRLQTVWQVKLMPVPAGTTCSTPDSDIPWPAPSAGQLSTDTVTTGPSGPCCLTPGSGYTGMENQFYRLEIHQKGTPATDNTYPLPSGSTTATFKWSRDNGSVATGVTSITGVTNSVSNSASQLTVQSMGRDQVLGFAPGNWIEIIDDFLELNGRPGEMHQIDSIDFPAKTITLDSTVSATNFPVVGDQTDASRHTRIRRWDQSGTIYQSDNKTIWVDLGAGKSGDIPVPPPGTTLILESGITVTFGLSSPGGSLNSGDFWTFAARTADGLIDKLKNAPPRGIHHHYARLSIVSFDPPSAPDCRTPWGCSSGESCGCCTCTVGVGGKYSSIQTAINALPASGGEVCILPGRYYEHVVIKDRSDIVIRGCGSQTRLASPSLQSGDGSIGKQAPAATGSSSTFNAVISVADSQNITLRSFAVEAAGGEVGILVDGTGKLLATSKDQTKGAATDAPGALRKFGGAIDTTIDDVVITASTFPAILAESVQLLRIDDNRIAMRNVESHWPAVYVSGTDMEIRRNWIGIETSANLREWLPAMVAGDLDSDDQNSINSEQDTKAEAGTVAWHPGGIQIAGPSTNVLVVENVIDRGARNGITLGSFVILDSKGVETGETAGLLLALEGPCCTGGTLQTAGVNPGSQGGTVGAGGILTDIRIHRNRIANMGLCGIGPAGFFNLRETLEIITIDGLAVTANTIQNTTLRATAPADQDSSLFGYGAICVPDVSGFTVRDNTLTNFGPTPGQGGCGIFILHGEMVEISRNKILETRDWTEDLTDKANRSSQLQAGIFACMVTPPSFAASFSFSAIYEPGLPALRVEENVVRVALGQSLIAYGFGPFAVSDNHFGCGGTVPGGEITVAQTVLILNLGAALETTGSVNLPSAMYTNSNKAAFDIGSDISSSSSSGAVLFTDNICQLETSLDQQTSFTSVAILTSDHLIFANNHCWLDASKLSVAVDAFLLAGSLQVTGNRFQEAPVSVLLSGWTAGVLNITSKNISTFCLVAEGAVLDSSNNLAVITAASKGDDPCAALSSQLSRGH